MMRKNDLYTIEEFLSAFRPSKEALEKTITLLLHHAEQLLLLASAFLQDGGHFEEHRSESNDMLETAIEKTKRAIESILIAEGILECKQIAHDTAKGKLHDTLLNLRKKIEQLGIEGGYHPEEIQFFVSPTVYFGIEEFEEYPVLYFRDA